MYKILKPYDSINKSILLAFIVLSVYPLNKLQNWSFYKAGPCNSLIKR